MKGIALVWIYILIGIFIIGFMYLAFSYVYYDHIKPILNDELVYNNTSDTTPAVETLDLIDTVWRYFPIILIFGLLLYGFVAAQKREPDEYYYR